MKETRTNRLARHEYRRPMQSDESVDFLPLGAGEQLR